MSATYPVQVKEFGADKTDEVDIVYAEHVNALQNEVEALQHELGTSPKNPGQRGRTYISVAALLSDLENRKFEANDTVLASSGAAATPGMSFQAQTDLGWYRDTEGMGLAVDGTKTFRFDRIVDGAETYDIIEGGEWNEQIRFYHGTDTIQFRVSNIPALDVQPGLVKSYTALDALSMRVGGVEIVTSTQRFRGLGGAGAGSPAYAFTNDADSGMYQHSSNTLGFATAGTLRFYVNNNGAGVNGNYLRGGSGSGSSNNDTLQPGLGFYQHYYVGFDSSSNNAMNAIVGGHSTITFYADRTYMQHPVELSNHGRALRFRDAYNAGLQRRSAGSGGFELIGGTDTAGPHHVAIVSGDGGTFCAGRDNRVELGTSGLRWKNVWAVDSSINTSDAREKHDIIDSDLGLAWVLANKPRRFRRKDGIRPHYGFIAQEVKEVMDTLDVFDFAGYIDTSLNPDPEAPEDHVPLLGLRVEEFVAPVYKAVQDLHGIVEEDRDEIDALAARVRALEARAAL